VITRFDETVIYNARTGKERFFFTSPFDYVSKFKILLTCLANPKVKHA